MTLASRVAGCKCTAKIQFRKRGRPLQGEFNDALTHSTVKQFRKRIRPFQAKVHNANARQDTL
jgi:hypothetical protein